MILETDTIIIAERSLECEDENDAFSDHLKNYNSEALDNIVHNLNEKITPQIDCTLCGACCRSLMINVSAEEISRVSQHLGVSEEKFSDDYLETGTSGEHVMNAIPCSFLSGNHCTVYEHRFSGCREFPHLHQPGFQKRLFVTFMHYGRCPIVYNVVEELKVETGFFNRRGAEAQR